jgi:CheY-like chemotaxis protein
MSNLILVDDDPDHQLLLEEALQASGRRFELLKMNNGEALLKHLTSITEDRFPFLIIMDHHMPGMEGSDIVKHLKENKRFANIPVAIFTGSSSNALFKELYAAGSNCVINKPDNFAKLKELAQSLVDVFMQKINI